MTGALFHILIGGSRVDISENAAAADGDRTEMPICGGELALGSVATSHTLQPVKGQALQPSGEPPAQDDRILGFLMPL